MRIFSQAMNEVPVSGYEAFDDFYELEFDGLPADQDEVNDLVTNTQMSPDHEAAYLSLINTLDDLFDPLNQDQ